VAEVTSLGLVQMTRKRIGTGLVEAFSVPCEHCHGRGVIIGAEPVKSRSDEPAQPGRTSSKRTSGRQRSTGRNEPEPERTDPLTAERHSAAAAATAAIAAALHLDPRHDADPAGGQPDGQVALNDAAQPGEPHADGVGHIEQASGEEQEPAERPKTKAPKAKKAGTSVRASTAKKSTATKRSTTRKKSQPAPEPAPEPAGVSS
jgi:ribonuclease E